MSSTTPQHNSPSDPASSLSLLTGASRGIGRSIAEALLDAGHPVIGTSTTGTLPDGLTNRASFHARRLDLADEQQVTEFLDHVLTAEQIPRVVINNAGVAIDEPLESSQETWLSSWDRTMQVNLRSPALICKRFICAWGERGVGGIIINIASRAAYRGDTGEFAAYGASKAGLTGFSKSIARSVSAKGVHVYTIAPGWVETDMVREAIPIHGMETILQGSFFPEITSPEEVARLVCILAQGGLPHMSGQTFHINGGSYIL